MIVKLLCQFKKFCYWKLGEIFPLIHPHVFLFTHTSWPRHDLSRFQIQNEFQCDEVQQFTGELVNMKTWHIHHESCFRVHHFDNGYTLWFVNSTQVGIRKGFKCACRDWLMFVWNEFGVLEVNCAAFSFVLGHMSMRSSQYKLVNTHKIVQILDTFGLDLRWNVLLVLF